MVKAAKRNYETFKTPTSFVTAQKVQRTYMPDEQADLDIKTSVNKIGEIVNLSQELNSLLWDKMYKGSTYEDIKDLYYDICQLDVMSGIEIDKAKKEFDIDNAKELDCIRKKYNDVFSCNDKKVVPYFFAHIARQKGYYNPERKEYRKYNTTMDYVQKKVNSFRAVKESKENKELAPFVSVLDKKKYRKVNVNYRQVKYIIKLLKDFNNNKIAVKGSDLEVKEKITKINLLYDTLAQRINESTIGFSTLYEILNLIDNKDCENINTLLLGILFTCKNKTFVETIEETAENVTRLVPVEKKSKKFRCEQGLFVFGKMMELI